MRSSQRGERKVLDDPKLKARFFFARNERVKKKFLLTDEGKVVIN